MDQDEHVRNLVMSCLQLHKGRENAVSIEDVTEYVATYATWIHVDERRVRQAIEDLRRTSDRGALICSSSGVKGRWLATSLNDVLENYREERRRAIELMVTIRERRERACRMFGGQLRLV